MQRFFGKINKEEILLSNEDITHLRVLRIREKEHIEVIVDDRLFECVVFSLNPLSIRIEKELEFDSELPKEVTLFFSLSKGDKNEFVIQKATELGANKIILVSSMRSVMKVKPEDASKKLARYQKIAHEAAIQSHRMKIPEVYGFYDLKNIPNDLMPEKSYVAFEKEAGKTTNSFQDLDKYQSIGVFIGPEGGYEDSEIEYLNSKGISSISLGKRILRCETSALYALSVLGYLLEK